MFGALASSVDLSTKDVLAPIGAVCGGVIAAFVAWFNARQTPSDRLQALLTIYKDWPDNVPGQKHMAGLIRGLLGEMWHRYPHIRAEDSAIDRVATRHLYIDMSACGVSLLAFVGSVVSVCVMWPIDSPNDGVLIILSSLVGGFAFVVAITSAIRIVRHRLLRFD
jgi:hypothetical protein